MSNTTPIDRRTPLHPYHRILLLRRGQMLPRQQNRPINRNRQPPMPPPQHNRTQNQLTQPMPPATERIGHIRQPDTDTDTAIRAHDLEDDVEDGVGDGVAVEV